MAHKSILNVRDQLTLLVDVVECAEKHGFDAPIVVDELKKLSFLARATLRKHDKTREDGNRKDIRLQARPTHKGGPNTYIDQIDKYGDMFTVEKYLAAVADGMLTDYDGHGIACRNGKASRCIITPSEPARIPSDATHIVWYNK